MICFGVLFRNVYSKLSGIVYLQLYFSDTIHVHFCSDMSDLLFSVSDEALSTLDSRLWRIILFELMFTSLNIYSGSPTVFPWRYNKPVTRGTSGASLSPLWITLSPVYSPPPHVFKMLFVYIVFYFRIRDLFTKKDCAIQKKKKIYSVHIL